MKYLETSLVKNFLFSSSLLLISMSTADLSGTLVVCFYISEK